MGTSSDISELDPDLSGRGLKIGIVMSRFNKDICEGLLSACEIELARLGVATDDVLLVDVPGALEHPLALQKMAQSGKFDAAGRHRCGGARRHLPLRSRVERILARHSRRQLETGVPIANAILTVDTEEQAHVRMAEKGRDAARVAIEMANLLKRL